MRGGGPPVGVRSGSPAQTHALGVRLGAVAEAGDVIGLTGALGAGKTVLTQGIAEGLGVEPGAVASPTFVLVREHRGRLPLFHVDLYRVDSPEAIERLGLDEYLEGEGVTVIEWAEKWPRPWLERAVQVELVALTPTEREVRLVCGAARFARALQPPLGAP